MIPKTRKFKSRNIYILLFIIFSDNIFPSEVFYKYGAKTTSSNIFGESGLIVLPSADTNEEGSITFSYSKNQIFKYGSISVSPFSWMEASYFYYRPTDLYWRGPESKGDYLDKGFSFKVNKKISQDFTVAIGMSDFAGTGFFTREYIVGTLDRDFYKLTAGLGFGKFAYRRGFKNPLSYFINQFKSRPILDYSEVGYGGSLASNQWFRGDASILFGAEFFLSRKLKNTSIKIDYDPFDYINDFSVNIDHPEADPLLRKKDSNINLGLNYSLNEFLQIGISYIKGNTLNLSFAIKSNFSKPFFNKSLSKITTEKSQKGTSLKETFYEDLILNINSKDIYLQTAELEDRDLKVSISSSKYRDPIHMHSLVGETAATINSEIKLPIDTVTTIGVNVGHELYRINTPLDYFNGRRDQVIELVKRDSNVIAGKGRDYHFYEFRPIIKYPSSFTQISPKLVNHIGSPQRFYFGGIVLNIENELQLSSALQINTEIHFGLTDNFDEKENSPDSYLPHVRTDVVRYLQESNSYISRMQVDYFFSPSDNLFGKLSGGILENMYAGTGVELLYKPFNRDFSFGFESYRVRKRAFDRKFDLLDYKINTGHLIFNYHFPGLGILGTLSYGKYLAGDIGYTFDISRRLSSGFRTGFFFTRTNVSAELFGEGSFDKGFYFQIPLDLFLQDFVGGYTNFKLRPLTRDGGQKLEAGNDLIGIVHHTSRSEIERYWSSFND